MTKTTPEPIIDPDFDGEAQPSLEERDERKRRMLLLLLLFLTLLCCCVGYFALRYLIAPKPLPEMIPVVDVNYPPTYKFSFPADKPVGVALSPDGERIYVAEAGGERLIKMFDRTGNLIKSFAPSGTTKSTRQPKYIAVDASGRVFLVDRLNNAIHIFDADGNYQDAILSPDLTISKILSQKFPDGIPAGTTFSYEGVNKILTYQAPNQAAENMTVVFSSNIWAPLGIRFDDKGNLIYSELLADQHMVRIIPADSLLFGSMATFSPVLTEFGSRGQGSGQFEFPQMAVKDSKGNFYVADGNNYRISSWTPDYQYRTFFAFGSIEGGLNLPRGLWMDSKDRLHVVDAVSSSIKVYDVSGTEAAFLYSFGTLGTAEGQMSYPIDIYLDGQGVLYIADSGNNRIQVWSY